MNSREHGAATRRIRFLMSKNLDAAVKERYQALNVNSVDLPFAKFAHEVIHSEDFVPARLVAHLEAVEQYFDEDHESQINRLWNAIRDLNGGSLPGDP